MPYPTTYPDKCLKCGEIYMRYPVYKPGSSIPYYPAYCPPCNNIVESIPLREKEKKNASLAQKVWRERHPEKARRMHTEWARRNPHKVKQYDHRRMARKRNLPADFTYEKWQQCLIWWDHSCAYCGVTGKPLEIEHFIPLSASDCSGSVMTNLVPSCEHCNATKHDNPAAEFLTSRYDPSRAAAILARIEAYFEWVKSQA
jgi:5-methylcytosine-specific restriction endonuclease McrA